MEMENVFDENGRTFQEILEQFLITYYNEKMTEAL